LQPPVVAALPPAAEASKLPLAEQLGLAVAAMPPAGAVELPVVDAEVVVVVVAAAAADEVAPLGPELVALEEATS
jgi:hypothetical protein